MRIYSGDKPCPACGKSGKQISRYSVDDICHECKDLIKYAIKHKATGEKFSNYVSVCLSWQNVVDTRLSQNIFDRLKSLCLAIHNPLAEPNGSKQIGWYNSNNKVDFKCTVEQFKTLEDLYKEIFECFRQIEKNALDEGTDLLKRLSKGSITLEDFYDTKKG